MFHCVGLRMTLKEDCSATNKTGAADGAPVSGLCLLWLYNDISLLEECCMINFRIEFIRMCCFCFIIVNLRYTFVGFWLQQRIYSLHQQFL